MAEQFAAGIGAAAHVVFLMQRCRAAFSWPSLVLVLFVPKDPIEPA